MNLIPLWCRLLACLGPALLSTAPVVAGALAPGYRSLPFPAPEPGSYKLPVLGPAADGAVLDADGQPVRLHALYDGRIVLLGFIYATCDDVNGCPLATAVFQKLKSALKSAPALAGRLRLLTLSFNPEHDTPEAMRRYGEGLRDGSADWRFLTTRSEAELQPILEAYGQSVQKEYDADGRFTGKYSHVLRVFLIDGQKRIRNVYTASVLHPDLVLADVETLLRDTAAPVAGGRPEASPPLRAGDDKTGYASPAYETHALALDARRGRPADLFRRTQRPVLGLPKPPVPADNPLTPARIALGRKLFYDRRLSLNQTFSCAMCHIPEQGFTSQEQATAIGIEGRTVRRNAPTLYNVAYLTKLFHDGRESSLENQVWGPLLAANEMGNPSVGFVVDRLRSLPDYRGLFEEAFGRGPGMETVGQALAGYERTLVSGDSPFDRWRYGHESGALTAAARKGFELFTGKAGCAACHTVGDRHALFTDDALHNTGVGYRASMNKAPAGRRVQVAPGVSFEVDAKTFAQVAEPAPGDLGLYEITQNPADRWKYRTPSLRNVALTAPYMHNGVFSSLKEVVEFYNRGGEPNENLDPLIRPLGLSAQDIEALVEFLASLTGGDNQTLVSDAFAAPVGNGR